jgi:hypothetical protein
MPTEPSKYLIEQALCHFFYRADRVDEALWQKTAHALSGQFPIVYRFTSRMFGALCSAGGKFDAENRWCIFAGSPNDKTNRRDLKTGQRGF